MIFLAAQSAARWNEPLKIFYERLLAREKPKKAAIAAVPRKLLVAINAMMRDGQPGSLHFVTTRLLLVCRYQSLSNTA